jgi:hypothetical protein
MVSCPGGKDLRFKFERRVLKNKFDLRRVNVRDKFGNLHNENLNLLVPNID